MTTWQNIADRFEIDALRAEFTDAGMMRDYRRLASLFTTDGVLRIPGVQQFAGRDDIYAGIQRLRDYWDFFVQNTHPGWTEVDGDTAVGRAYIAEFGRLRDGSSHLNYSVYHDRYRRTADGWKFSERRYETFYLDSAPLTGSAAQTPETVAE